MRNFHGKGFVLYGMVLTLAFGVSLVSLFVYAAGEELHSHIVLVPLVSAYLLRLERKDLPGEYQTSLAGAAIPFLLGSGALAMLWGGAEFSVNDRFSLIAFSYLSLLVGGGLAFLGGPWMKRAAFPVVFLVFMIPLPDMVVSWFETFLMVASADASELFFRISDTPYLRDGQVFQIPGMVIEVAQECSGIRSSWVLFITSFLASYLILRSPWRRILLVAVVIPLGVLRNGFRVLVIGLLCVHYGPHMIDSIIHRRGGPAFFALSLIPFFLLLWLLRRGEAPREFKIQSELPVDRESTL